MLRPVQALEERGGANGGGNGGDGAGGANSDDGIQCWTDTSPDTSPTDDAVHPLARTFSNKALTKNDALVVGHVLTKEDALEAEHAAAALSRRSTASGQQHLLQVLLRCRCCPCCGRPTS